MYYISKEWDICYGLALEAWDAGSIAVGSIVTDTAGELVSRGRNQMFDCCESVNKVKSNTIAHAELNAILNIPETHRDRMDLVLWTTVEPCPMCLGAIAMSNIRVIKIGSKDGWAGSVRMLWESSYLQSKNINVVWADTTAEKLFYFLHIVSELPLFKDKEHAVLKAIRKPYAYYDKYLRETFVTYKDSVHLIEMVKGWT